MTETVQLSIKASNLPFLEKTGDKIANPFSIVTLLSNHTNTQPVVLGKTEVIEKSRNPHWVKTFFVKYEGGSRPTYFLIKIFHQVDENEYKELGSGVFEIGEILRLTNNTLTKKLRSGGTIDVQVEKVVGIGSLQLKMSGVSLKKPRGCRNKLRPFFQLSRKDAGSRSNEESGPEWSVVHRSDEVRKSSPNLTWNEENIDLGDLCYNDVDLPLRLSVYHHRSSGKHIIVGEVETSVNALIAANKSSSRLQISNNGTVTGALIISTASMSITNNPEAEEEAIKVLSFEKRDVASIS